MPDWSSSDLQPKHSEYLGEHTLFPMSLESFEVMAQVSADEMRRWHDAGWLSFDPYKLHQVDWAEDTEVRFIRALARSGLSDERISELLAPLAKPYCYGPERTFYSFEKRSWITLPPKPAFCLKDEITGLVEVEDWDALEVIRDDIDELLEQATDDAEEEL